MVKEVVGPAFNEEQNPNSRVRDGSEEVTLRHAERKEQTRLREHNGDGTTQVGSTAGRLRLECLVPNLEFEQEDWETVYRVL